MSLSFLGPGGSFERRWIVYAMLRDNVQHHLEGGTPSPDFACLHALGEALVAGSVAVPALSLRSELMRARQLLDRPIDDLAISLKTRAAHMLSFPPPEQRSTDLVSKVGGLPPFPLEGAGTLGDAFGSLVLELLRISEGASPSDVIEVVDS
jgi:hypothetical protein